MTPSAITEREQALAKWIDQVSNDLTAGDDRKKVVYLCQAAMVLSASDDANEVPVNAQELRDFVGRISRGVKARGGKRSEAAVGACYAALASVVTATRGP